MSRPAHTKDEREWQKRAIPAEMEAAVIDEFGPPSVLKLRDMPVPRPVRGEVLIAVHAAGVGEWDAKLRDGTWAEDDMRVPLILGTDGAGRVAAAHEHRRGSSIAPSISSFSDRRSSSPEPARGNTPRTRGRRSLRHPERSRGRA